MADTVEKERLLKRLAELATEIKTGDEEQTERRAERNRIMAEVGKRRDTTITEVAKAADVTHSYATRAIRGKGDPGSGSRRQADAERKKARAA